MGWYLEVGLLGNDEVVCVKLSGTGLMLLDTESPESSLTRSTQ